MAVIEINHHPSLRDLRYFAALWSPLCWAVIGWIVWRKTGSLHAAEAIWAAGALVSLTGLVWPAFMRVVFVGWMYAVFPIGWLVSHLMLAAFYFLIVSPIGLALRLARYDPLQRRLDRTAPTYWTARPPSPGPSSYFRQF